MCRGVAAAAVIGFAAALAAAGAAPAARPAQAEVTIVAFGDSLTSGHRLPKHQAYPAVLEARLREEGFPVVVVNRGVSGNTSAQGLRRLEAALEDSPDVIIVAFGANDGLRGVPVARVRENLAQIIETAEARRVRVLLVGMEALPIYGLQYMRDFRRMYAELAAAYRVPLVPFMLAGVFGNRDLMAPDGIHPNAEGARVVAATILPHVRRLVEPLVANRVRL